MTDKAQGQTAGGAADRLARRGSLRMLLFYTRTAWYYLAALLGCIVVKALLDLSVPWVMGFMLFDGVIRQGQLDRLPAVVGVLVAIFLGQKLFSFLQEYFNELSNQRIVHKLRCDLFDHMQRLPLGFFDRRRTGDLQARLTGDVDTADGLLKILVEDLASELITLVGTIAFLWAVNPGLTLYVLPTIPALAFSVFFFKRTIKHSARRIRDLIGDIASTTAETIGGVRVVKAFGGERFETERFAGRSLELLRARVRIAKLQSVYSSTVDVWVFVGTIIVILTASPRIVAGTFTVGALVAYLSYLNKLYGPAKKLSKINVSLQKIVAAGDRIFEVMSEPTEAAEEREERKARAKKYYVVPGGVRPEGGRYATPALAGISGGARAASEVASEGAVEARAIEGAVSFERVSFDYGGDSPVLRDFDLSVEPGESVALVGHSGGGKTTVINLLLRFYRPSEGRILIDGTPIERLPHEWLRRQVGLVQQETFLFSGTVRDNIAYACPDAPDERIVEAARAADAHDFICALPQGYLTALGERGVNLSGGQRQRIAIARALLRDPRILVFDEATSHLDFESEQAVQRALMRIARGRTVFVVAHRLTSVWWADKIVVIDRGEIVQSGRHQELLEREGFYRRLYNLQRPEPAAAAGGGN